MIAAINTVEKTGTGTLIISGAQTNGTASAWTVSAGTLNLNSDAGSNTTVNANSTTNFGSSQHLAELNIGAGATATLTAGAIKNLVTGELAIAGVAAPTGKLDITDNAAIVDYPAAGPSPAAAIRADPRRTRRQRTGQNLEWSRDHQRRGRRRTGQFPVGRLRGQRSIAAWRLSNVPRRDGGCFDRAHAPYANRRRKPGRRGQQR